MCFSDRDDCLEEIKTLPGQKRIGLTHLISELSPLVEIGLKSVLLFGVITQSPKVPLTTEYLVTHLSN